MPQPATTLFEDAIDVPEWLEADRDTPFQERVRRDRELGRTLAGRDALESVRAWWRGVRRTERPRAGARLERVRRLVAAVMVLVGLLAGASVALAAFQYDGSHPVNVVRLLALLAALPLALLLLTLLLIPPRMPGLRAIQDLLAAVNPGALGAALLRRLTVRTPELGRLFDRDAARSAAAARFAKWQLLYWSQLAAAAFAAAALATGAVLITFTDLAFGWSTTLAADPRTVERIVAAIALPWRALLPGAVPDLALVEQSQYFRLEGGAAAPAGARTLGAWWPFTMLAIATYGLLPRLAMLAIAGARLRAATRALLLENPDVTALLDRMRMPAVETASDEPHEAVREEAPAAQRAGGRLAGSAAAVVWGGAIAPAEARDYARRRLGIELTGVVEAGGGASIDADSAALERIADEAAQSLVVFTPAWEPPLLELLDFLAALRRGLGAQASIAIVPVPETPRGITESERAMWARGVARARDPHLYLEPGAE